MKVLNLQRVKPWVWQQTPVAVITSRKGVLSTQWTRWKHSASSRMASGYAMSSFLASATG